MPWYDNYTVVQNLAKIKEQLNDGSALLESKDFAVSTPWSGTVTFTNATPAVGNYVELVADGASSPFAYGVISADSSANFFLSGGDLGIAASQVTGYVTQNVVSSAFTVRLYSDVAEKANWIRLNTAGTYNENNTAINVPLNQSAITLAGSPYTVNDTYTINVSDLIGNNAVALGTHSTLTFTVNVPSDVATLSGTAVRPDASGVVNLTALAQAAGKSGVAGTIDVQDWAGSAALSSNATVTSIVDGESSDEYVINFTDTATLTTTTDSQGFYNGGTYASLASALVLDKLVINATPTIDQSTGAATFGVTTAGYLKDTEDALVLNKANISSTPTIASDIATFSTTASGAGYLGNSTAALALNCYTGTFEN